MNDLFGIKLIKFKRQKNQITLYTPRILFDKLFCFQADHQVSAYLLPLQGDEKAFEYKVRYSQN